MKEVDIVEIGKEGGRIGRQFAEFVFTFVNVLWYFISLLAPQSGALRISAYRDFQSNPIPLIAFEHLSLSMVI